MSIIPLKPSIQLPSYPLPDFQGCYYHLAHPDSIRAHVRCFLCSFDDADPSADVAFESFGPWAAEIGYSLFLLAEHLEGSWLDRNDASQVELLGSLRCYSGWWTFSQCRSVDVESVQYLCEDTLAVMDRLRELIPVFPQPLGCLNGCR